ncbi:MAG: hypothetical protein PHO86_01455 [Bacilli bacterium]|nr:hypothetical protein [Bacilli bacterium]
MEEKSRTSLMYIIFMLVMILLYVTNKYIKLTWATIIALEVFGLVYLIVFFIKMKKILKKMSYQNKEIEELEMVLKKLESRIKTIRKD